MGAKAETSEEARAEYDLIGEVQKDELCRGKQLRSDEDMSKLYCRYMHGGSNWLKLGPLKVEINHYDPYHVTIHELMFENECDAVTQYLGPKLDFPPGRMDAKSRKNDWTMKNTWPIETEHP